MYNVIINASSDKKSIGLSSKKIKEYDITYKIASIIKEDLLNYEINTYMLRGKDEVISYEKRVEVLKKKYPIKNSIVLSISLYQTTSNLFEVIYPLKYGNTLAKLISDNLSKIKESEYFQMRYTVNPKKDYYYFTRLTEGYLSILIRIPFNEDFILKNYKAIAHNIADSIIKYTNAKIKNTHIVKKGDTLYSIAKKYNTTVDNLKKLNNLKSNLIHVGDKIKY